MRKMKKNLIIILSVVGIIFAGIRSESFDAVKNLDRIKTYAESDSGEHIGIGKVPEYSGNPYIEINGNIPSFSDADKERIEEYSELDKYGRCGTAFANVGKELMPVKERESIRQVRPSGWHTVKYEDIIKDRYLYNRCHLIAYKLAGENANEKNLITGTRYMNVEGMLPFEDIVSSYVRTTGNHVLYRVRPIFKGNDLVARGVQMEAKSLEDNGEGVSFNVYCYNVQPGIKINYKDGSSYPENKIKSKNSHKVSKKKAKKPEKNKKLKTDNKVNVSIHYIANKNTKKFHISTCRSVKQMKAKNMMESDNRDELISSGYVPCKICNP